MKPLFEIHFSLSIETHGWHQPKKFNETTFRAIRTSCNCAVAVEASAASDSLAMSFAIFDTSWHISLGQAYQAEHPIETTKLKIYIKASKLTRPGK